MTPEEAIKILQLNKDRLSGSVRMALETLHPELAESEDERIRRWIRTRIENLRGANEDAEKELSKMKPLALDWLEKQEEQKPAKPVEGPKNCWTCRNEKHCFRAETQWSGPCEDYEREER